MTTKKPWILAIVMSCLALMLGVGIGVYAQTAPSTSYPLYYSGALEAEGKALTGTYAFTISVWDKENDGTQQCSRRDPNVDVVNGRFRVDMGDCAAAIRALKDAWVQVSFTGPDSLTRDIVKRAKVGAVPYALEAERSARANEAEPNAGIDTRLKALEARLGPKSGISVRLTNSQAITADSADPWRENMLKFDRVDFDFAGEYDKSAGVFVPKNDGFYYVHCEAMFNVGAAGTARYAHLAVLVGGLSVASDIAYGDMWYATRAAGGLVQLRQGDTVACGIGITAGGGLTVRGEDPYAAKMNVFRVWP